MVRQHRYQAKYSAGIQACRYLCRGVCDHHSLPVFDIRGGVRGRADQREQDHHSRRWSESYRSGHRIRLLLRARGLALREVGYETIMVNCNPETVSTDYDTSDRLYFEPLTFEDVMEIIELEKPRGVIVQYGGQTPLKLARSLEAAGAPIIGTSPDSIDLAEDRERFQQLLQRLDLKQPPNCIARTEEEAVAMGTEVGFPLVVRPSYVLGGRAMEIVHNEDDLRHYMSQRRRGVE